MNFIRCIVCGESVNVGVEIMCDKCKSAILKMRRKMDCDVPEICIIRMINEKGDYFYITKAPKMATSNSIECKINILTKDSINNMYHFSNDIDNSRLFTRTKANKICKSFYLLQENGYFNQFVSAEILKDNQIVFHWDFKKKENKND